MLLFFAGGGEAGAAVSTVALAIGRHSGIQNDDTFHHRRPRRRMQWIPRLRPSLG